MLKKLERDHLNDLHDHAHIPGCLICEKDARIDYQKSMLSMIESSYVELVNSVDRILKGVHAYHQITDNEQAIIPFEHSLKWISVESGLFPLEGEEVYLLIDAVIDGDVSQVKSTGFYHRSHWYSWATHLPLKDVIAWRKIRGQLDKRDFGSKGRSHKP